MEIGECNSSRTLWKGIIEEYREFFPVTGSTPVVTLLEGNTPLVKAVNLPKRLNFDIDIYLKFDGVNPTGSFKDRGMTLALSKAAEAGSKAVICASTGNTSASAAAYAARAGITAIVVIPEGKIALGKLAQALVHGAHVVQVEGNFDDSLKIVKEVAEKYPITLVNSINPFRIEGQKSAAFEICDQLGFAPKYHALPVGNAGNITAYWKGYKEYYDAGAIQRLPKMLGFQAAGAAPIVLGRPVEKPETIATAIRIGNPASWKTAVAARDESGGRIDAVTDEEILTAYRLVASEEGIFCEPASAASLAGVIKLYNEGYLEKGETVVCTLTGNGLKDPDTVFKIAAETIKVKAEFDEVRKVIEKIL
ncbi:MAG: threonine synthase [Nitrospirae bacterium GWC2_46_6]|nr:MAG: threonine synthase [Nitrospirae bacterium GWC2_46_6]OGW19950.1 MAG: threonine synthase [Nitrospirae bacterium GWA2_46_11]OGW25539.1 MAG: threonine synthase [Nitrospirae bacterium GWB2_47_37]HAK89107.1 threonine synthase [Nitrospiraceae bacterium]HCZ12606.1 threonine synthase [Nitrospiraceae bacterium]